MASRGKCRRGYTGGIFSRPLLPFIHSEFPGEPPDMLPASRHVLCRIQTCRRFWANKYPANSEKLPLCVRAVLEGHITMYYLLLSVRLWFSNMMEPSAIRWQSRSKWGLVAYDQMVARPSRVYHYIRISRLLRKRSLKRSCDNMVGPDLSGFYKTSRSIHVLWVAGTSVKRPCH